MARLPGRNGRLYAGITSAGTAEPIPGVAKLAQDQVSDKYDVTAMGDLNKQYVAGIADYKGTFSGSFDDASQQFTTAATDGIARKFYFYVNTLTNTPYWFGTAFFDFHVEGDVGGPWAISGNFAAASAVARVG